MPPIVARRWKSKFARFVQSYGLKSLAVRLDVTRGAIYHWIDGSVTLRPSHAEVILRLARERRFGLTMEEIYRHTRRVREDDSKLRPGLPLRPAAVSPIASSLRG
jgi:hypothetical protein